MKTIKEMSEISGVSIRTLRYYDEIGLLKPACVTQAGYRLYDRKELERLQEILFFRELEFPLSEIKSIVSDPAYDRRQALCAQKEWMERRRNRLNGLIQLLTETIEHPDAIHFDAFRDEELEKILDHMVASQSESSIRVILEKYGSLSAFRKMLSKSLREEAAAARLMALYGGREGAVASLLQPPHTRAEMEEMRDDMNRIFRQFATAMQTDDDALAMDAVEQYAERCKHLLHLTNARALLLRVAEDYLNPKCPEVVQATEAQFGTGIAAYIARAIQNVYGV